MTRVVATVVAVMAIVGALRAQTKPATPLEPIAAILDAFRTHDIVALGEGRHNNEQGYAFRLALIRDPRFAAIVNDIVVESGSSTHQAVMDRFIAGEEVPAKELRLAWQDTTVPDGPWDVPMYEEFFRAIRALNQSLPVGRKLRVLLGDPPFDWDRATREEAIRIGLERDPFAAELIRREVLAQKRRALIVYGDGHFARRPPGNRGNIVTRLVVMGASVLNGGHIRRPTAWRRCRPTSNRGLCRPSSTPRERPWERDRSIRCARFQWVRTHASGTIRCGAVSSDLPSGSPSRAARSRRLCAPMLTTSRCV